MKTRINPLKLDSLQESSDRLYAMLLMVSDNELRTEQDQIIIDTLIQVLKSMPTIKPIEFNRFN